MKVKFPTNKEVLRIERQRAVKNHHYFLRFICLFIMMIYLAIWFSYKSQPQVMDYQAWIKLSIVTAIMATIHLSCWFFAYLRHWLQGGVLGLFLALPYLLLFLALPKKDQVEYKAIDSVRPEVTLEPKVQVLKTKRELIEETIKSLKNQYQQKQISLLLLHEIKANQSTQVREYFDALNVSEGRVTWTKTPYGDIFVFQNLSINLDELLQLAQQFTDETTDIKELNVAEGFFNEVKFNPQFFNDRVSSQDNENSRQVKVAAGWFNTLNGYRALDMQSTLINLKNTDNRAYAADIEVKLASLLFDPYIIVDRSLIFAAYINWVQDINEQRQRVISKYFKQQKEQDQVDDFLLELAFNYFPQEALPLVEASWLKDLRNWEVLLQSQPDIIEPRLLEIYNNLNLNQKKSALKILSKIGKAASLAFIEQRVKISETEERIFLKSSASTIKTRLAN